MRFIFLFLFFSLPPGSIFVVSLSVTHVINLVWPNLFIFAVYMHADNEISSYYQKYIIGKEGEYPTSLWACVTTLYGVMTFVMIFTYKVVSQIILQHHIAAASTCIST